MANVKRQESSKVDPYLPSKPSASFLPAASTTSLYQNTSRYSPSSSRINQSEKISSDIPKENKSTLSSLSDLDLIRKAEEELAAVAAATITPSIPPPSLLASPGAGLVLTPPPVGSISDSPITPPSQTLLSISLPSESVLESSIPYKPSLPDSFKKTFAPEQPKPPGLEDEDFPAFPTTPLTVDVSKASTTTTSTSVSKVSNKSGIVVNIKRKMNDTSSAKVSRTKSRWGQGPSE